MAHLSLVSGNLFSTLPAPAVLQLGADLAEAPALRLGNVAVGEGEGKRAHGREDQERLALPDRLRDGQKG
jgi:hypothetical protein